MDLKGKVILITGASHGIGKCCALYFASLDANIIMTYHDNDDLVLKNKKIILLNNNVSVDIIKCNLKNENDIIKLRDFIKDKYNHLDILINNASISLDSFYLDKTKKEFMEVLETNLVGTFLMIKYLSNITDYIFNISSTDGINTGSIYNLDYSCSKASINLLTKYLADYDKNTTYISICPNWVKTEPITSMNQDYLKMEMKRIKQDKLIEPNTIPKTILKCIENKTKSGEIIRIDGDIDE